MARPNYRDTGRASTTKSGGPIGWLQSLWGKRVPGYRSERRASAQRQNSGMFAPTTPDYRCPDASPPAEQCCYTTCGPCKMLSTATLTPTVADPTTLSGPVTIIVNGQE
jgi:hypothetical protein